MLEKLPQATRRNILLKEARLTLESRGAIRDGRKVH